MRLFWILIGSIFLAAGPAGADVVFKNDSSGDAVITVIGDMLFDLDGEGGEGSLVATTNDNDLACSGAGLETVPGVGRSLIRINISTGGSLPDYYVDGEFTYDAIARDMKVSAPGLNVACIGSVILNDGFED
jgi:hypothetical protein